MTLLEFSILAFSSLFVIVDPVATVPIFLSLTPHDSVRHRERTALISCITATAVLIAFGLSGAWLFRLLGITLPAFQIAGSILLMRIALDMLYARRSRDRQTREEIETGAAMDEVAITPLAVPLLAGPGAITAVLILLNQASDPAQRVALFVCIGLVLGITYALFRVAAHGARWMNPLAMNLITRLMGLLLAAIAVQFSIDALMQTPFFGD